LPCDAGRGAGRECDVELVFIDVLDARGVHVFQADREIQVVVRVLCALEREVAEPARETEVMHGQLAGMKISREGSLFKRFVEEVDAGEIESRV
jgi:hypothetical protein